MSPHQDAISVRTTRLNNLILSKGCGAISKSPFGIRRSLIPVNNVSPAVAEAICREGLLDALYFLYSECNKDTLKRRDRNIAEFVNKYRQIIEETCQLRVNVNDFIVKTVIGKGYFGNVHLVVERQTGDTYAMKKIKKSIVTTSQVKEERDIMARRCSEWITNLQYAFQDADNLYLVMEFLPGGDLLSLMSRHGPFDEDLTRFYLAELTLALHSLHSMGYVHRDVKPENILIDRFGHIKLADFGNAAALDRDGHVFSLSPVGTPDYIAPELLQTISTYKLTKSMHDVSCDFWSMGIIGYELICEITPFHDDNVHETYSKILSHCEDSHMEELIAFPSDIELSANYKNLIESLVTNPKKRLSYDGIKKHPFFESIKWNTMRAELPPIIPKVTSDDDTSNFDGTSRLKVCQPQEPHKVKKSPNINVRSNDFSGKDLPFIGYSFVHMEKQVSFEENSSDETRVQKLTEKIKELQVKLKEHTDEIGKLKYNLLCAEQIAKQYDTKSKVLQDAKEEIKKLQNIIKEKTVELAAYRTQIKTLQSAAKIEEEMWEKKESTITDLLRLNRQKYEEAKIASEQRYEKQLADKKNELASILQKLDAREAEFNAKLDECKHLGEKLNNYKDMLRLSREQTQNEQLNFEQNKLQISEAYEQKLLDLRTKLRQEQESNKQLTAELENVRTELTVLTNNRRFVQEAKNANDKNNEQILKRLNEEIDINNKLRVENSTLEKKLQKKCDEVDDLQLECKRLERELKLVECSENLTESKLATPYDTAEGSLNDLHTVEEQLRADLEKAKEQEHVQKERADKLQELVIKLEEMFERFNAQSLSPSKSFTTPRHAADDILERQNEKLEDKLATAREQMVVERQAARTANLALWKMEKNLDEITAEKKMLQRRMELTEERSKKVQNQHDEAQRMLKNTQAEINQRDERIKELKVELGNCKRDVLKEHQMWEKSEQERMKCKSELIEHIAKVYKLEERVSELRQKLQQTQQRCDGFTMENKRLVLELNEERLQNNAANDKINATNAELENLKINYERLKYACSITDNQLTEIEAMLEAEQKRNKTQQDIIDKLYANLNEKDGNIEELTKEMQEEQSGRNLAEKRVDALKKEIDELNTLIQDKKRKEHIQQEKFIENTNSLIATQERIDVLSNDINNLQTLNNNCIQEIHNLKEENTRLLTELFHCKEQVCNLQGEIKEKVTVIDDLNGEIDEVQNTLIEKENYYVQRDIKAEATLAQHKKLIDYLQLKIEDLLQKKKKTLADKLFGSSSSSTKENISPNDVESSILYRALKEELRREKQLNKSLQEQLERFKGGQTISSQSPVKSAAGYNSQQQPDEPKQQSTKGALHMRSPHKQHSIKRAANQVLANQKSPDKFVTEAHHFELALQESELNAADCVACLKPIMSGSPYWKCKICKAVAHRKCRSDVNTACDGIAGIIAKTTTTATVAGNKLDLDVADDSSSLDKLSCKGLDTVDTKKLEQNAEYVGTLVFTATDDALEINCAYEIKELEILLLGCNTGLYAYHVNMQRLVHIVGIDAVNHITVSERLAKVIMVGALGEKLHQCDFRQLESRCQNAAGYHKPSLESYVIELPFANRTASEKWKFVQISNETENALDSVAIAATSTRIVILKYDLKLHKFKPVRALDTVTPVTSILYTKHSAIVSSDKFYEIDLDNYDAEEFVDFADKSLSHIGACQPLIAVRLSRQEFLLCFAETGIFVDEYGCRSRPYELNWIYTPTGFMYREPFLYISHYQSVQILRLHRSYTKEIATAIAKTTEHEEIMPDFQRVYLSHFMPSLLTYSGDLNLYTLAIQQENNVQQIYHLDALQAFKAKLNISMETVTSVATSVTVDSAAIRDST